MGFAELGGFLAMGALFAIIGKHLNKMVFSSRGGKGAGSPGWHGVWYVTMWAHPIVEGALLGAFGSLHAPKFVGDGLLGGVIWYALAGGLSPSCYNAIRNVIKHLAERGK